MERKRRPEISLLNIFCCLTVIFIHVVSYAVSAFPINTLRYTAVMIPWRMATFVVPGFVLLAGVKQFLGGREEKPYLKHLKSRFFGIVIPYAVCFAVYYVYFMITADYPVDIAFMIKHFVFGSLVYHLYFIPIILQFDLLFPLWKRIVKNCSPVVVLPFALLVSQLCESYFPVAVSTLFPGVNFQYNDRFFMTYIAFWLMGCYIGKYYDSFCEILKKNFKSICVLFAVTTVTMVVFSYLAFNQLAYVPFLNFVHYLYVVYVIMFLFAVSLKVPENVFEKAPVLKKIDRASLYIYLYHVLVIIVVASLIK